MVDALTLLVLGVVLFLLMSILVWISNLYGNLRDTQKEITEKLSSIGLLSSVATGLQNTISSMQTEIGNIKQQAERIATLGKNIKRPRNSPKRFILY